MAKYKVIKSFNYQEKELAGNFTVGEIVEPTKETSKIEFLVKMGFLTMDLDSTVSEDEIKSIEEGSTVVATLDEKQEIKKDTKQSKEAVSSAVVQDVTVVAKFDEKAPEVETKSTDVNPEVKEADAPKVVETLETKDDKKVETTKAPLGEVKEEVKPDGTVEVSQTSEETKADPKKADKK